MKEIIYYERDENKRPVITVPWKAVFDPTLTPYEQTLIAKSV